MESRASLRRELAARDGEIATLSTQLRSVAQSLHDVANDLAAVAPTLPSNTSRGTRELLEQHVRRLKSLAAGLIVEEGTPDPEVVASLAGASRRTVKLVAAAVGFAGLAVTTGGLEGVGDTAWHAIGNKLGLIDAELSSTQEHAGAIARSDRDRLLMDAFDQIDQRLADIVRLRWGLDRGEPRTLDEVAEAFDLTPERIRQIEARAIRALDDVLAAEKAPVSAVELLSSALRSLRNQ